MMSFIQQFYQDCLVKFALMGQSPSFVTLCESNAKALLTGKPIKNATCKQVLRPAGGKLSVGQHTVLTDVTAFRRLDTAASRLPPNSATLQCL